MPDILSRARALLDAGYDNGFGVTSLDTLLCEEMDRASRIDFAAFLLSEADKPAHRCHHCSGRGFLLDYVEQGSAMVAMPGDKCEQCAGSGEIDNRAEPDTGPKQAKLTESE